MTAKGLREVLAWTVTEIGEVVMGVLRGMRGRGKRGGGPIVTSSADPMAEPDYVVGVDTMLADDQFQYADAAAVTAAGYHLLQTAGVCTMQAAGGRTSYPNMLHEAWSEVRTSLSDGTTIPVGYSSVWDCSKDAAAGVEDSAITDGHIVSGSDAAGATFVFEWHRAFDSGFRWEWLSPTAVPSPTCARGGATKEFLIYREAFGGASGRWGAYAVYSTFHSPSGVYSDGTVLTNDIAWEMHCGNTSSPVNTKPSSGSIAQYAQHLNHGTNGVDKTPRAIADGAVHRFRMKYRNESVLDAGDGFIGLWVDGYPVIYLDGLDNTKLCSGKVYTRQGSGIGVSGWQTHPTMNAGSPYNQSSYFNGFRIWQVG